MANNDNMDCMDLELDDIFKTFKPEEMISDESVCKVFKGILGNNETQISVVIKILEHIGQCMTLLNEDHKSLIKTIVNFNWLDHGPEFTQIYTEFVLNLLSVHGNYFKQFLIILVKKLREEYTSVEGDSEEKRLQAHIKMEQNFHYVHILLQSICRLIPMSSVVLLPLLEESFPFINKAATVFENYTRNLLKITGYVPSLRREILDLIVKHMLKQDVRISRDALTSAITEAEVESEETMFTMDVGCDDSPTSPKEYEDKLSVLLPPAVALDAMMAVMLTYIKDTCFPGGVLDWTVTKKLYREFLSSFEKYVFPTNLSNHTQFIMFYICSFKEALVDGFIDYLWKKVTDPMSQPIFRQVASCYLGSFLARANYIPLSTSQTLMKLMVQWVHNYMDQTCDVNREPGVEHHAAFYSVCQTCFYIFCFKHTDFIHMKKGHKWAEALNFQRIVTNKLNPLKYCSSIIVKTFSSATRTHQLAFCDTIIERNNRYSLPVAASNSINSVAEKQLHSFFPFDPYLLKKSGSFIGPLYKQFQGNLPDDDGLDSEEDDDFLPDEGIHMKSRNDKSAMDFLHYSVSPGFQYTDMT